MSFLIVWHYFDYNFSFLSYWCHFTILFWLRKRSHFFCLCCLVFLRNFCCRSLVWCQCSSAFNPFLAANNERMTMRNLCFTRFPKLFQFNVQCYLCLPLPLLSLLLLLCFVAVFCNVSTEWSHLYADNSFPGEWLRCNFGEILSLSLSSARRTCEKYGLKDILRAKLLIPGGTHWTRREAQLFLPIGLFFFKVFHFFSSH